MPDSFASMALAGGILVLAGFVKGVVGLGLPTISIGLLGLLMMPQQAAALLVVPNVVTNVWQLLAGPRFRPLIGRMWPMLTGICGGTFAASGLLSLQGTRYATLLLGLALVVYAGFGLARVRLHAPQANEGAIGALVGATTGLVTVATGVFVVPAVPFLQALDLGKEDLVQALGLSFLTSTVALAALLAATGRFEMATAGASLAALAPALIGMLVGQAVRGRLSHDVFRLCFLGGLMLLGTYLAIKSWP